MGTKMGKRLFCFILAFAMAFTTVVTGDLATVQAATDYSTIKDVCFFDNSNMNSDISSVFSPEGLFILAPM